MRFGGKKGERRNIILLQSSILTDFDENVIATD